MSFYFFVDTENLNTQSSNGYGPSGNVTVNDVEYEQFLITSSHSAQASSDAIAVSKGQILVQQQAQNSDLVNIVFRPTENQPFAFPKIGFLIYKGIKKESLVDSDGVSIADASSNDLTAAIWQAFNNLGLSGSPSISIIGLSDDINALDDTYKIDDVFNGSYDGVEFLSVNGGDVIGQFDPNAFGFEIVLESIHYLPTLDIARSNQTIIQSPVLPDDPTQQQFFDHWNLKELILYFVDPCAFFASFYAFGLNVVSAGISNQFTGVDLYDNAIVNFLNKNLAYVDIRNEFNFSLNYFKNYGQSPTDNTTYLNVQIGASGDLTSIDYYSNSWPILILDNSKFDDQESDFQSVALQLPAGNGDNPVPLAYFSSGYPAADTFPTEFAGSTKFFSLNVSDNYTENLTFGVPWDTDHLICSYTHIKYNKQSSDAMLPAPIATQIRKIDYLDGLFGSLINFNPQTSTLTAKVFDEEIYIDTLLSHYFDAVFNIGINFDALNAVLFVNPYILNNSGSKGIRQMVDATGSFSASSQSNQNAFYAFGQIEGGAQLTTVPLILDSQVVNVIQYETSGPDIQEQFDVGDARKILGLNITLDEWNTIVQLASSSFVENYPWYIMIANKQYLQDDHQIMYISLEINLAGYVINDDNIAVQQVSTNINLMTYGNF